MDVAVIGAGRVGTALAVLLWRAGHRIVGVTGGDDTAGRAARYLPGVPVEPAEVVAARADLVLLATPDDEIAAVCAFLAGEGGFRGGQFVGHVSGATGLAALTPARAAGAGILSFHPLQTFPDVDSAIERVPGSGLAVTAEDDAGYELGERLARDIGATPFRLHDQLKPLYHAAAVFASNYVVTVLAQADRLFRAAGVEDLSLWMPLSRSAVDALETLGPDQALTGPAVRGDAGTVRANLQALHRHAPEAVRTYAALATAALDLAERSGRLSSPVRRAVEEVLAGWR